MRACASGSSAAVAHEHADAPHRARPAARARRAATAAAPPRSVMNSRRLMQPSPEPWDHACGSKHSTFCHGGMDVEAGSENDNRNQYLTLRTSGLSSKGETLRLSTTCPLSPR